MFTQNEWNTVTKKQNYNEKATGKGNTGGKGKGNSDSKEKVFTKTHICSKKVMSVREELKKKYQSVKFWYNFDDSELTLIGTISKQQDVENALAFVIDFLNKPVTKDSKEENRTIKPSVKENEVDFENDPFFQVVSSHSNQVKGLWATIAKKDIVNESELKSNEENCTNDVDNKLKKICNLTEKPGWVVARLKKKK